MLWLGELGLWSNRGGAFGWVQPVQARAVDEAAHLHFKAGLYSAD